MRKPFDFTSKSSELIWRTSLTATSALALSPAANADRFSIGVKQPQAQPALRGTVSSPQAAVTSLSTARLEVAPAGTYVSMQRAIAMYHMFIAHSPGGDAVREDAAWGATIDEELSSLATEARLDGIAQPSEPVVEACIWLLTQCAKFSVSEPAISNDEESGVEIYFKEKDRAALFSVKSDRSLIIYWDSPGDKWRAKFSTGGDAWKQYVKRVLGDLVVI